MLQKLKTTLIGLMVVFIILTGQSLFAEGNKDKTFPLSEYDIDFQEEPGLVIVRVIKESPAEKAGIVRGDILMEVESREINAQMDIFEILKDYKGGDTVNLRIIHGDKDSEVQVTLEDRVFRVPLGLVFERPFPGRMRFEFPPLEFEGMEDVKGAVVTRVVVDSPAAYAGLKEGDIIVSVNDQNIDAENPLNEVILSFKPGDVVTLKVKTLDTEAVDLSVTLGENEEGQALLGVHFIFPGMGNMFRFHEDDFPMYRKGPGYHFKFRDKKGGDGTEDDEKIEIYRYKQPLKSL